MLKKNARMQNTPIQAFFSSFQNWTNTGLFDRFEEECLKLEFRTNIIQSVSAATVNIKLNLNEKKYIQDLISCSYWNNIFYSKQEIVVPYVLF